MNEIPEIKEETEVGFNTVYLTDAEDRSNLMDGHAVSMEVALYRVIASLCSRYTEKAANLLLSWIQTEVERVDYRKLYSLNYIQSQYKRLTDEMNQDKKAFLENIAIVFYHRHGLLVEEELLILDKTVRGFVDPTDRDAYLNLLLNNNWLVVYMAILMYFKIHSKKTLGVYLAIDSALTAG